MKQEAERRAGGDRSQNAAGVLLEVERDDRERRGDDRADPRRETVDAVGEVDHVHHRDEADHGQRGAGLREREGAEERKRDVGHVDAAAYRDDRREDLPGELDRGMEVEAVVERADQRDHRAGSEDPRPGEAHEVCVVHAVRQQHLGARQRTAQPDLARHRHRREHREAAQPRCLAVREATLARLIDRPDAAR